MHLTMLIAHPYLGDGAAFRCPVIIHAVCWCVLGDGAAFRKLTAAAARQIRERLIISFVN